MKTKAWYLSFIVIFFIACSPQRYINQQAHQSIMNDSTLSHAHVGISLYDPSDNKYLYNYQGDKYFVPASNTKIITCYAGLKYLGDSLTGIRYWEDDQAIYLLPTGDPTLLHGDFKKNPVIDFLQQTNKKLYITDTSWKADALGAGWSWGDYNSYYMVERSPLPVYGNVLRWTQENNDNTSMENPLDRTPFIYSIPEMNWNVRFNTDPAAKSFYIQRSHAENTYLVTQGTEKKKVQDVPFVTNGIQSALELLPDTIGKEITLLDKSEAANPGTRNATLKTIHSQPTDSLLTPLMHRSDNFYAEQTLLMVSNEKLGIMSEDRIIDTLLKTDLRNLPQVPRWTDGSGLSRYNLFTPQIFVAVLNKMQQEFGMDRLKGIFPTGGRGTLRSYYKQDSSYIYAKTGTLSGVVAFSGYLYTKKNRLLIFSVLVNNHHGSATDIRRRVETFLRGVRQKM